MKEFIKIVGLSVGAAITYGIIHDQITARICVEYFTVAHPPVFATESPTLLGLGWGVIATWWVGMLLGVPMGLTARIGTSAKITARELLKPIGVLLLCMAIVAGVAGVIGWWMADGGTFRLPQYWSSLIRPDKQSRFVADAFAHQASYAAGFIGGIVLIARVWLIRRKSRAHGGLAYGT